MKYAILVLIGLLMGAMGATVLVNSMRQRDAYARGAMDVMQHHYAGLREGLRAQRCETAKTDEAIVQMRALTNEIEPAIYPGATPDAPFREFTQRLRDALNAVPSPAPGECSALAPLVQKIGKVCDDCHQQYR